MDWNTAFRNLGIIVAADWIIAIALAGILTQFGVSVTCDEESKRAFGCMRYFLLGLFALWAIFYVKPIGQ